MSKKQEAKTEEVNQEVVPWAEKMASSAKEVAEMETAGSNIISIKGGVMQINGDPIPGSQMDVVIIGVVTERRLYTTQYDPDVITLPACYAQSITGVNMAPAGNSPDPQNETCRTCPKDQFKTAANGKGKACKESRKMLVIPMDNINDPNKVKGETGLLSVPITSVKKFWGPYVKGLSAQHQRPPWAVVTTIKASPDNRTILRVEFTLKDLLTEEQLANVFPLVDAAEKSLMQPFDYEDQDGGEAPKENTKY